MSDETTAEPVTFASDVRLASPIPQSGLGRATVISHPDVRVIILTFAEGHVLKEHKAPFPLLMQALDGELLVRAGGREMRLIPGALLRLDTALPHEVEAVSESRLMLTLETRR